MIIDGTNVATIGVIVGSRSPSRSAAATQQIIEGAPGAWRRNRLGRSVPDALSIQVVGHIVGDTLSELRGHIDNFKFMVRPDTELAIRWSDMTGDTPVREWLGYRTSLTIEDLTPGWVTEGVAFTLILLCPDPFAREVSAQTPSDPGAQPRLITPVVGTAPCPVVITITGNAGAPLVTPELHYRDKNNNDITTLSIADTLDDTETVVIDTEFFTAEKNGSNIGELISGSYFDINPGDGDYLGSPAGPDIRLTAASGTANTFSLSFKRRYW